MERKHVNKKHLNKIVNGVFYNKVVSLLENTEYQTVNNIAEKIKVSQPTTSIILNDLKILKIVNCQVDGQFRRYSLNKKRYEEIVKAYTQIDINEKEVIDRLFDVYDLKERDPLIYKQRSKLFK